VKSLGGCSGQVIYGADWLPPANGPLAQQEELGKQVRDLGRGRRASSMEEYKQELAGVSFLPLHADSIAQYPFMADDTNASSAAAFSVAAPLVSAPSSPTFPPAPHEPEWVLGAPATAQDMKMPTCYLPDDLHSACFDGAIDMKAAAAAATATAKQQAAPQPLLPGGRVLEAPCWPPVAAGQSWPQPGLQPLECAQPAIAIGSKAGDWHTGNGAMHGLRGEPHGLPPGTATGLAIELGDVIRRLEHADGQREAQGILTHLRDIEARYRANADVANGAGITSHAAAIGGPRLFAHWPD